MLREAGCVPAGSNTQPDSWMNREDEVKAFKHMVKDVLNRCVCCGEKDKGPSAACSARHENKDCNCFAKEVA